MPVQDGQTVDGADIYQSDLFEGSIATGDVFDNVQDEHGVTRCGVVLTPMCDLAQGKARMVKMAEANTLREFLVSEFLPAKLRSFHEYQHDLEQLKEQPAEYCTQFMEDSDRPAVVSLRCVKDLQRMVANTNPLHPADFFLPSRAEPAVTAHVVDLSHVFSVPQANFADLRPAKRLHSPWREQLLSRYVAVSMRVGTKDYARDSVCQSIMEVFPELSRDQVLGKMK